MQQAEVVLEALGRSIQMAIAPVFLLSAVAAFLNVLNSRLARVIDRTRVLLSRESDEDDIDELDILARRRGQIDRSITLCVLCALLISAVVMLMFVGIVVHIPLAEMIAVLFIASMLALMGALLFFVHEVHLAVSYVRSIRGYRK